MGYIIRNAWPLIGLMLLLTSPLMILRGRCQCYRKIWRSYIGFFMSVAFGSVIWLAIRVFVLTRGASPDRTGDAPMSPIGDATMVDVLVVVAVVISVPVLMVAAFLGPKKSKAKKS